MNVAWREGLKRLVSKIRPTARVSSKRQREIFTAVHQSNGWGDAESVSGPGSTIERALQFRDELVALLRQLQVRSILDAPCGDFNWMGLVLGELDVSYIGVDIVEALVRQAERRAGEGRRFLWLDLTKDDLPAADLILCRDAMVHLSFADALAALRNFRRSGACYLLATTFIDRERNEDIRTGGWRPLNLQVPPFSLPEPLALVDEHCTHTGGIYRDKRLGLWEINPAAS